MGLKLSGFSLLITAVLLFEGVGAFVVPSSAFVSLHANTAPFSLCSADHFLLFPFVNHHRKLLPTTHSGVKKSLNLQKKDDAAAMSPKNVEAHVDSTHKFLQTLQDAVNLVELARAVGINKPWVLEILACEKVENNPVTAKLIDLLRKIEIAPTTPTMEYSTYQNHPEFPDYNLSTMMKKMRDPPPVEYFFSLAKIGKILIRFIENMVAQYLRKDEIEAAKNVEDKFKAMVAEPKLEGLILERFNNPLNFHPRPTYCIDHWEEDKYVARQFLCGANPVMIKVAKSMGEMSKELVNHFGNKYLQDLIGEKRLLYVSYDDLAELTTNPHQAKPLAVNSNKMKSEYAAQNQPRYFYAPIALFILDEAREELDILGIQLDRKSDARVYTKNSSEPNEWLFVKSCLTTADSQMHEWVNHLGRTHLAMEPHIIAIHNTLRKSNHPIYTFVQPLCQDTLVVNWAARFTIAEVGPDSFGDTTTSVGFGQILQLIEKMWSRYNFFETSGLPLELASRGFDEDFKIPAYLFREDGMKLWNAYGDFAADFVSEVYPSDSKVASDKILQEWANETSRPDRAAVPGFPKSFQDKATLTKVLQTLMWMTSGAHAAVNFPQYDYLAFGPNKPWNQGAKLPESDQPSITREWLFSNFPTFEAQQDIVTVVYVLTLPSDHCIDNLHKHFSGVGEKAYMKFQLKLKVIEAQNDKIGL
jgi:hypothetical protein